MKWTRPCADREGISELLIAQSPEIHTPLRRTPPPQAVSSYVAVSDGLPCCHSLGWTLSDYAMRFTVTS